MAQEVGLPQVRKKKVVELTDKQLSDVVTCVGHALQRGLGYGHVTRREEALLQVHREHTLQKLKALLAER